MTPPRTPQELADEFQMSREAVLRKCRSGEWPHRRLSAQTILFTAEDVAAILDISLRGGRLSSARQP